METILLTVVTLLLILALRNELVYKFRIRAINDIFKYKDWAENMALLEEVHYYNQVLDITTWTYKGFYPKLYAREHTQVVTKS